jgi:hypothetical protein
MLLLAAGCTHALLTCAVPHLEADQQLDALQHLAPLLVVPPGAASEEVNGQKRKGVGCVMAALLEALRISVRVKELQLHLRMANLYLFAVLHAQQVLWLQGQVSILSAARTWQPT